MIIYAMSVCFFVLAIYKHNSDCYILGIFLLVIALFFTLKQDLASPFKYPYFEKTFDVSGKRKPDIENLIEQFICEGGFTEVQEHCKIIANWKSECEQQIQDAFLQKLRRKQFEKCLDDNSAFHFYLARNQTRYIQRNYVKTSYEVTQNIDRKFCSYEWFNEKYRKLETIGFETTLKNYHSKNQRKLMNKELRESIAERDNYTCQMCGKYMPDGVGLQIDHIIPIAKGGKSVPSNLQVLCSKCNGSKSDKIA